MKIIKRRTDHRKDDAHITVKPVTVKDPDMDAIVTELEASWIGKPTKGPPIIRKE